jgi:sugar phosphate permease
MAVFHQLGGASAAFLAGVLRVDLGSYLEAFMLAGMLCFVAAVMVLFIGSGREKPEQSDIAPAAEVSPS